jgi:hypothetical protein
MSTYRVSAEFVCIDVNCREITSLSLFQLCTQKAVIVTVTIKMAHGCLNVLDTFKNRRILHLGSIKDILNSELL